MIKKVYITGITGLLGSNLAKYLQHEYIICGSDRNEVDVYGIAYDVFDLCDNKKLITSLERNKPDIIIHCAAMVNVDLCEEQKGLAQKVNLDVTAFLADYSRENHCKLIFISSDAVFDGTEEKLYDENDVVNPINQYARTKVEGERTVLRVDDALVLRTNIYGINLRTKKSFGEWVADALYEDETLNMFGDIDFSPILVSDFSIILSDCIKNNLCGIYHLCGTGNITKFEFGVLLKASLGIETGTILQSESRFHNFLASRPQHMGLSNDKIKKDLQIEIRTPQESIIEFCKQYKEDRHIDENRKY